MGSPPKPVARIAPVARPSTAARAAIDLPEADAPLELVGISEFLWEGHTARAPRRKVALVADDDAEVRKLVAQVVRSLGCDVLEAPDGAAALLLARERRPDVVVLDAMMPGLHGFDACRAIKGDPALAGIAVILCSAAYRGGAVEDARARFGADGAVEKPFRIDELRRVLRSALREPPAETPQREEAQRAWRAAADAMAAGSPADAAQLARTAIAADASCAEAHYYLGQALSRTGAPFEAVVAYETAAALRPDLPALHERLAELCEQLEFPRAARVAWLRAAEACQDPVQRRTYWARLLRLVEGR